MFSSARALAELANVDGCVVLDRKLRLYGFGGEIRVGEEQVQGWQCSEAHPDTLESQAIIDVERWGTRHRSAFRLCCVRPGATVFVVSQDGDLRVFYGHTDNRVCAWQSLGSWMTASDRW
jgi:DNA integrity scanning protein DisA with diadenylate cyclase activity